MIDAGADIILGNHVHAVQGVEQYKGKTIIYSPGTFVGRQLPPESEGAEITDLVRSLLDDMSPGRLPQLRRRRHVVQEGADEVRDLCAFRLQVHPTNVPGL